MPHRSKFSETSIIDQMHGAAHAGYFPPTELGVNTVKYTRPDGTTAIRVRGVDIILLHLDSTYSLFHGGRGISVFTVRRYQRFTPARISKVRGLWHILTRGGDLIPITDGMRLDVDGYPVCDRPTRAVKYVASKRTCHI